MISPYLGNGHIQRTTFTTEYVVATELKSNIETISLSAPNVFTWLSNEAERMAWMLEKHFTYRSPIIRMGIIIYLS